MNEYQVSLIVDAKERLYYKLNWDGYGGIPAPQEAVDDIIEFTIVNLGGNIDKPHLSLAGDGEVCLYWQTDRLTLDLGSHGDGDGYSFYGINEITGEKFYSDGTPSDVPLIDDLMKLIENKLDI